MRECFGVQFDAAPPRQAAAAAGGEGCRDGALLELEARLRGGASPSPYSGLPGWQTLSLIVKSGDDCRQEQLAAQLISVFDGIFRSERQTRAMWLRPYSVISVRTDTGLIEPIDNALSIHALKERCATARPSIYHRAVYYRAVYCPHRATARPSMHTSLPCSSRATARRMSCPRRLSSLR